jgi:hypothetical protein
MRNLLILFVLAVLFSCKRTITLTDTKETIKTDTFQSIKIVEKFSMIRDTLLIESPCDSSGILTNFYSRLRIPNGSITIQSKRGKIEGIVSLDSSRNEFTKINNKSNQRYIRYVNKEVIKYRIPDWVYILLLIEGLILFIYIYLKAIKW